MPFWDKLIYPAATALVLQ